MAVSKLSQIATGVAPALTDTVIGVVGGTVDQQYTLAQLQSTLLGIGSAIANGTQGSVLFIGAGGILAQDNAKFFWDDTNTSLFLGGGGVSPSSLYPYNTFTSSTNFERGVLGWNTQANTLVLATQKGSGGGSARDIWIEPSSNVLKQINGANAQSLKVFKTTDGAGNDEYGVIDWQISANVLTIGTAAIGTGVARELRLSSFGVNVLRGDPVTAGNFFLGNSGNSTLSGQTNTAVGSLALASITSGNNNVALGQNAGTSISSGSDNFALGRGALGTSTTGGQSIAVGSFCLANYNGTGNVVAIGDEAFTHKTSGGNDVAIGGFAGWSLTSGANNTMIGPVAGFSITSGDNNTLIGGWLGVSSSVSNAVVFSDGAGNIRLDYNWNTANALTFSSGYLVVPVAVASLPAGSNGMRHFVTDATATTFASIVAGGGANKVPVYYDGNWRIG